MSDKSVLVINKPYSCVCCMCRGGDDCFAIEDIEMKYKFHDWYRHINSQPAPGTITWENCPLKSLPKQFSDDDIKKSKKEVAIGMRMWNACLDAITGEAK